MEPRLNTSQHVTPYDHWEEEEREIEVMFANKITKIEVENKKLTKCSMINIRDCARMYL